MSKFNVGDRVKVVRPSGAQYTWISSMDRSVGNVYSVTCAGPHGVQLDWSPNDTMENDFYFGDDCLKLATEGGEVKPYQRKTYKLLRDTPELNKGAIFQEQCDDGTQPYECINLPDVDKASQYASASSVIKERSLVEDQPKWFVEVFKVTPEYMTREELDQWEAFKASKKPRAKSTAPAKKSEWTPAQRKAASKRMKAYHAAKKRAA